MATFVPGRLYITEWPVVVGGHDLTAWCARDGRALGCLADPLLVAMFSNLEFAPKKQRSADVIEDHPDGFRVWEIKSARLPRVDIQPSHCKGVNRKHDPERFTRFLDSLNGGIIAVDLRKLPRVAFRGISVATLRAKFGESPKGFPTDFIHQS